MTKLFMEHPRRHYRACGVGVEEQGGDAGAEYGQGVKSRFVSVFALAMHEFLDQPGDEQCRQQVDQAVGQPYRYGKPEGQRPFAACPGKINPVPGDAQQHHVGQ